MVWFLTQYKQIAHCCRSSAADVAAGDAVADWKYTCSTKACVLKFLNAKAFLTCKHASCLRVDCNMLPDL